MRFATPRNLAVGLLGASVIGLGAVVVIDHTMWAPSSRTQTTVTATNKNTSAATGLDGAALLARAGGAESILKVFTQDTGLTAEQLLAGVRAGKTLDDLAGAGAGKLKADLVAALTAELDKAVTKGAISAPQESSLLTDAGDAISVLMSAKLGALFPPH